MVLNEQNLYDSNELWHIPIWHQKWFHTVLIGFIIILLVILLYFGIKKYLTLKKTRPKKPFEKLLENLILIKPNERTESKLFYSRITIIIKEAIKVFYNLSVESYTDQELLQYIQHNNIDTELFDLFSLFSKHLDETKFFNARISKEMIDSDYQKLTSFIKNKQLKSKG